MQHSLDSYLDDEGDYTQEYKDAVSNYDNAIEAVAEKLFNEHCLTSTRLDYETFELSPMQGKTWEDVANAVIETINGYGMFYFSSLEEMIEGPYENAQEAAMKHLHWLAYWHEIYGDYSPRRQIDRRMR